MLLILFIQKSDSIVSPNNKTLFFPLLLSIAADEDRDEEIGIAGAGEANDGDEEKGEILLLFIFLVDDDDEEIISIGDSAFLFVCLGLVLRR